MAIDALFRRPHPAHAHVDEWELAHLPAGGTLAASARRYAHRGRNRKNGLGLLQRAGGGVPYAEITCLSSWIRPTWARRAGGGIRRSPSHCKPSGAPANGDRRCATYTIR